MFGFKKSVDDILGMIAKLSNEEKEQLLQRITPKAEETDKPDETESSAEESEGTPEAEEVETQPAEDDVGDDNVSENDEQAENVSSTEVEPEKADDDQPAELPEASEEAATESTDNDKELDNAQLARIEALESEIAALKEIINKYMGEDENRDFGLDAHAPEGQSRHEERASAVMRGYAGNRAGEYM